jgi:hypothetical protein
MRRTSRLISIVGILCLASIVCGSTPVSAALLTGPQGVQLKRGSSPSSNTEAVADLAADDGDIYPVTARRRRGRFAAVYNVKFVLPNSSPNLTMQVNASTSALTCGLSMALFRWRDQRWVTIGRLTVDTVEVIHTSNTVRARPYVRRQKVLGRVICSSRNDYGDLITDRVRLID